MKKPLITATVIGLSATTAHAAGLDRSGQSTTFIFNDSQTLSFSYANVNPDVTGTDSTGAQYDAGETYDQMSLSYVHDLTDTFTLGFIAEQPYGANVSYNGNPLLNNLAGTGADLTSESFSLIGKYQFSDRVSVFGGLKAQTIRATVDLNGVAYRNAITTSAVARAAGVDSSTLGAALLGDPTAVGALGGVANVSALGAQVAALQGQFVADDGYSFAMDSGTEYGWLVGAAYEIPDIAFRLAVTYHAEIDYSQATTETILGNAVASTVDYVSPEAVNIDFQTGIAENTLLLASYRWTAFEDVDLVPTGLGSDLVNLDNGERFTLGIGRRFTDNFSGSIILSYEPEGDDLVSPLGPTNGLYGIAVGGRYTRDNIVVTGGINYSWLGDALPEIGGQAVASFEDNSSLAVGLSVRIAF